MNEKRGDRKKNIHVNMYIVLLAYFTAITGKSHLLTQRNPTQLLTSPMLIYTGCTKQTKVQAFLYMIILINKINLLSVINSRVEFWFFCIVHCYNMKWQMFALLSVGSKLVLLFKSREFHRIYIIYIIIFMNINFNPILYIIL